MNTKNKGVVLDIITGILSAVISFFLLNELELGVALIAISPFPLIAGYIRGRIPAESRVAKVILMNLLFLLLLMAIMNGVFHLVLILALALIGTNLGIYARLHWATYTSKTLAFLALYAVSVLLAGLFVLPAWLDATMWEKENYEAPEFTLLALNGDTIKSSDYEGKIIVLDFWATWCGPCKQQFPLLEKIYLENMENDAIVFFTVHAQTNGESEEEALDFIKKSNYSLPFVNDLKSLTYDRFNVSAIPHVIIIDQEGIVRFTHTGYQESDNFYEKFNTYINSLK